MKLFDFKTSYKKHIQKLLNNHNKKDAVEIAVGGNYESVGRLEKYLVVQKGLQDNHRIIDIGCGSGRLAFQLHKSFGGQYIGIDIVDELYEYAKKKCNRADWKFYKAPGLSIPEPDDIADFVCFFSVFTHLLHEESYMYLKEAKRVLKSDGKIIFSFLDFKMSSHWQIFEQSLQDTRPEKILTQFISRDAIEAWAKNLNLKVENIYDSDKLYIKLKKPVKWDDGREMKGMGSLGQSVCVLTK